MKETSAVGAPRRLGWTKMESPAQLRADASFPMIGTLSPAKGGEEVGGYRLWRAPRSESAPSRSAVVVHGDRSKAAHRGNGPWLPDPGAAGKKKTLDRAPRAGNETLKVEITRPRPRYATRSVRTRARARVRCLLTLV